MSPNPTMRNLLWSFTAVAAIYGCDKQGTSNTAASCQPTLPSGAALVELRLADDGTVTTDTSTSTSSSTCTSDSTSGTIQAGDQPGKSSGSGSPGTPGSPGSPGAPRPATGGSGTPIDDSLPPPNAKPGDFNIVWAQYSTNATPSISWDASTEAASYTLIFARDFACTDIAHKVDGIKTTSATPTSPLSDGAYVICVKAHNALGDTDAGNSGMDFVVDTVAPPAPIWFDVQQGRSIGNISIQTYVPDDRSDYASYSIRAKAGSLAPADCNDGSEVYTTTNFLNVGFTANIRTTPGTQWSFRGCAKDAAGNVTGSVTGSAWSQPNHHIFATHGTWAGNLKAPVMGPWDYATALEGADDRCNRAARSPNSMYNYQGTWKAIISTSTVNAKDRVTIIAPVYNQPKNTTPKLIANDAADLWDSALPNNVYYDEFGNGGTAGTWTGSNANGTSDGTNHCNNWTSGASGVNGIIGYVGRTNNEWFSYTPSTCDTPMGLYCIDQ